MKFLRYGPPGAERPAVLVPGSDHLALDLSDVTSDVDGVFLANGGAARVAELVADGARKPVDLTGERIGPPIARPSAIYGIGLNYRDHAAEAGLELPTEPVVFTKPPNSLVGPTDPIVIPPGATQVDWEVELGVVIGRRAANLASPEAANDYIGGYVAVNDVSERAWQMARPGQWIKGKSFATSNPAGPYLVTPDELPSVGDLRLKLAVNGETMQDGTTADLVFTPDHIIWYLSQFLVLEPGDLIDTGTPAGIGMRRNPPRFLAAGDVVELEVAGLGEHRSPVEPFTARS
ncbi:fumarylacetoacetate hydrolase family protein [Amycolatopsis sp. NPDC005232]|uniref:fumarylacetoacetate hydrolase family protein n=1 Tax=Amycolatopsis sp. NPDC005232 TaxID=3157027 RepID=UPI0033AFED77